MMFSYSAYKTTNGKVSFRYSAMFKGCHGDACAWNIGLKVSLSKKKAETRMVLTALKTATENRYAWVQVLMNAKEVVQALIGEVDWAINSIIADI